MRLLYFIIAIFIFFSGFAIYVNDVNLDVKEFKKFIMQYRNKQYKNKNIVNNTSFKLYNFRYYNITKDGITLLLLGKEGFNLSNDLVVKTGYAVLYNGKNYNFVKSKDMFKVGENIYCVNNVLIYNEGGDLHTDYINYNQKTNTIQNRNKVVFKNPNKYLVKGNTLKYDMNSDIVTLKDVNATFYEEKNKK